MRNSQISNRNFTAIGPSGSGKSVSANKLISGLVQTDEYFNFILDDGESYEMLHYLMGEKSMYMRMTPTGEELSFNPFLIPFVDPKNDPEKLLIPELEMLTSLILLLWDQNNGLGLKDDPGKTAYIKSYCTTSILSAMNSEQSTSISIPSISISYNSMSEEL